MLHREVVAEFAEEARAIEGLEALILYGSVARGEATRESDIDLLAIVRGGEFSAAGERLRELEQRLEEKHGVSIELVVMSEDDFRRAEKNFVENILREGVLLFGKPVVLRSEELELQPYVIFVYYLKHLDSRAKQRLYIALYGHRTRKRVGEKEYVSEVSGWIESGAKLERKVVMFPEDVAARVRKVLKAHGARFLEIKVYATREEFEKVRRFSKKVAAEKRASSPQE